MTRNLGASKHQSARRAVATIAYLVLLITAGCQRQYVTGKGVVVEIPRSAVAQPLPISAAPKLKLFLDAALEQSKVTTGYDPSYVKLDYPNGDVPRETGVCSDVVVRAFRGAGIDLQKEVHEDMTRAWAEYPRKWGARGTDANIDHRRVLNLATWFERQGKSLAVTNERGDYLPGDVVAWELSSGVEHIGILTNIASEPDKHFLIVHNIGGGAHLEDALLSWKIIGHYRYF